MNLAPAGGSGVSPGAALDDEIRLVERARAGDLQAFADLFRRHHRAVYRTVLGLSCRAEDAEDAVQTAFVNAWQHLHQFEGRSRFATWVTRIAINEALGKIRDGGRLEPLAADGVEDEEDFMPRNLRPWEDDPETLRSRDERRELVEKAILALPPRYRAAVLLRDIQGMTAEEAAEALGLNVATLKTHLLRGRLRLREALAAHFAPRRRPTPPTRVDA
ncbi:MAG TPA: sigma-70 family RNA polymerase sigma factor [Candidatus Polarisedimenticolia bacterium]|nr:sigma-70 family RNA polymerase sigma factor [Candidatus Polarisedimenticolia bacterium]